MGVEIVNIENNIKPRKALNKIKPYSPGKPIWEVQEEFNLDTVIKLASNENPLGPSPKALDAICNFLTDLNRYPDANATHLKKSIASFYSLNEQELIIGNGADELITLISETFLEPEDEIIVPFPSFSEYDFGANLMGSKVIPISLGESYQFDIEAILAQVTDQTKLVYICSPNNPTGTYLPKNQLEKLLHCLPQKVLTVFDGAYSHFATESDYTNGIEYVASGYPIIVLQTFSKIYGLAGIRVGFAAATEEVIHNILKVKEPFNVNTLAQAAATAAIADERHVQASYEANKMGREQLYKAFSELGLQYTESMSNFVLVKIGAEAKYVYEQLLQKGIIVRFGSIWGLPEHIRISVGTFKENTILINAVTSILKEKAFL